MPGSEERVQQLYEQSWPAPAKLNLFLHIIGQREDGYHLLQTVFQFLDYADNLRFEGRQDSRILRSEGPPEVDPEHDLVVRAARLLQSETGAQQGVNIQIEKKLPIGGGLGGGSSDAATTLVALNILWQTGLTTGQLAELGLQIGADVPVFIHGLASWAEGVGEQLTPVELDQPWFLVLIPPVTVSTAKVFSDSELTRNTHPIKIPDFLAGAGKNDCELVVCQRYPEVAESLEWLRQFGDARMTGTGACMFLSFPNEADAQAVAAQMPEQWSGFVARGMNRSPLLEILEGLS
ncbi:MAG: 4-(cytidine 5'-diphospho)-2-C-methyl-D-erythritol kinase [Gammaproteobacteria bacterium]|nr:4-(cytidine 5'-diphospho)-2-C-methyl-D-erythritol kinase [Gammaproteobacteria bacterium]MCK5092428.1 4-(cytidine 5'-diphospho)-2-C-methyl-D-erythritol kinase [Gammaproteobacteria bacterium]